ncbi:MAG: mannose-1-phosphate guanylyltransferase [Fimbriimonadaceae bacterium]|nr:mannose-1-phosphate guanylyltransferase [Fimbriimonadaceae bacterium]QYK57018.1 MAG: mannose-1-phosphate guanylyltransferase [Fimbriimonadaceae bacterium]
MSFKRIGVIMAGGSGERFWPVSTKSRPKQFLRLTSPEKSLLAEAADRASELFGVENTIIATGLHLAEASRAECASLADTNVLAEPAKRNTTGCLVWVVANLIAQSPEAGADISMAVLTADHRISPPAAFHKTVTTALETAERTGGLVTIGIRPTRAETGYGYIEVGEPDGDAFQVESFREKPDAKTAIVFVSSERFLWNSGMFFWTVPAFMAEMERAQPEIAAVIRKIAGHLSKGENDAAVAAFESLPSISIDYALMEKAERVWVVAADFDWDDLGAWDSLSRSYDADEQGNVGLGSQRLIEVKDSVVYNESETHEVCLLGVEGLAVVVTNGIVMVCPKDRAQEVRKFSNPG